ncbi:tyrosine-protein phosphatase [Albidovulum sediminicola]|uniref:Tyrosine-protein phosphatase n=1 Tax=Albidovulum sediminicola TaxID=2984331 RepID=A0ABT2Z114_9RHOB|nr:tyrosine-protein phosphatase [Defluviimonas sp. WL0075]MCV2864834.1 tyrosine-protein phosphatase [Defluviimonas sp. WL0075]
MFDDIRPERVMSDYFGPTGFFWLVPGLLGGAARPGLGAPMERDLAALARVGARLLVTLTEEWEPDVQAIESQGMASLYVPVPDRMPPSVEQMIMICREVERRLEAGQAVVHHCHAGKGRTGTALVAQLIWRGLPPAEALAVARQRNPRWVESAEQEDFLERFGAVVSQMRP